MCLLFASLLLTTACGDNHATSSQKLNPDRLVLSSTKPGSRLDPHLDIQWEVLYVLSAVYDTLVFQDAQGNFVPGLASSWEISEDGLRYRLELREDVTFHDGSAFDAAAVKFNFERIRSLATSSLKASSLLASVESVALVDDYTIDINLSRPDGAFLFNISLPYIAMVSPQAAKKWGDNYHLHQSGTGPFMFSEYRPGDRYVLVRNPEYRWAPSVYDHSGPAKLHEIEWRFLPEPSSRAPALEAGDVDVAFDLVPTNLERVLASPRHTVSTAYLTGQPAYWFLNTRLPPTDEIEVRKALLYASDMAAGTSAITRSVAPPAHGPLSRVTPEYAPELDLLYPHDPDRAKALLQDAGWIDQDGDGIRERDGRRLVLTLSMVSWGQSIPFSVLLQAQLREVGIDVQMEAMAHAVQIEAGQSGRKNILFTGSSGYSAADSLKPFFHSDNVEHGFAFSKFSDPEIDHLLDQAAITLDSAERDALYQRAQMRIMEQALILPIYDYALLIGVDRRIAGLEWRSMGLVPTFYQMYYRTGEQD
jgi:peptide/nickel transport system substrate-binding protein